jgi:glucose/arabinose dehydrogenase
LSKTSTNIHNETPNFYPSTSTAVNQIEFGNKGELYINVGSNTNGGLPGKLSGSGQLKENYFSAATLVADLSDAKFDGFIEYDTPDDGSPINYSGVFVFAPGLRNPFGLTMHSNGNLYGTDNGPNAGYGNVDQVFFSLCFLSSPLSSYSNIFYL